MKLESVVIAFQHSAVNTSLLLAQKLTGDDSGMKARLMTLLD